MRLAVAAILVGLLWAPAAFAAIYVVRPDGTGDFPTIQAAMPMTCALGSQVVLGTQLRLAGGRTLLMHSDGTYEDGYCWWDGSMPPDWGSFGERYDGAARISGVVLDFTTVSGTSVEPIDVYVWENDGGMPGQVLAVVAGANVHVPTWPEWARNVVVLGSPVCVGEVWWVGYWGNWPAEYFITADLDGPGGGVPMTKVGPGLGYPTGWQDIAMVWHPTAALGIGAEADSCPPTPVEQTTWGALKSLFRVATR